MPPLKVIPGGGLALLLVSLSPAGCDAAYPEVVVEHRAGSPLLLRDLSFNGCRWSTVLRSGDVTSPRRCLPGQARVHFLKLDTEALTGRPAVSRADAGAADTGTGADLSGDPDGAPLPTWFNYQTVQEHEAGYGEFLRIQITPEGMEQDFSVPGPYGH